MVEAEHIYQAIGDLLATLVVVDGKDFLETLDARYRAFVPRKLKEKYFNKYQGHQVYWRVYPQDTDLGLAFKIASVGAEPWHGHGYFVLRGDWVEPGQFKIWRNATADKVNAYNWQPRLLPINWSDAPAPDEAFWQLKVKLIDGAFTVVEALGPFPHPPRLEKLPDHLDQLPSRRQKQLKPSERHREPQQPPQESPQSVTNTVSIDWESIAPVSGKLELTIKINTLPQVQQINGQCHFKLDCDGRIFQVSVKQKQWSKLETANATYEQWVAAMPERACATRIAGQLGAATLDGFVLESPNILVFERKQSKQPEQPKQPNAKAPAQAKATEQPLATSEPSEATQTAKIRQSKTQAVETTTAESVPQPSELADPRVRPSTPKSQSKPKKIGR